MQESISESPEATLGAWGQRKEELDFSEITRRDADRACSVYPTLTRGLSQQGAQQQHGLSPRTPRRCPDHQSSRNPQTPKLPRRRAQDAGHMLPYFIWTAPVGAVWF